jgi:hypothetical protein
MTNKQTAPALWPKKVYISAFGSNNTPEEYLEPDPYWVSHTPCADEKAANIEYIRADIAPKSLTQEEMQRVLECIKMGLAATMYVHGMESKSKDFVKEIYFERQEKLESLIAILKEHLKC